VAACAESQRAPSARDRVDDATRAARFLVVGTPPRIAAADPSALAGAEADARALDLARLAARRDSRHVPADALALLANSPVGRRFLALETPRALARGRPARSCPAVATAGSPGGAAGRAAAAGRALERCLAALRPDFPGCGCELLALDSLVTVPRGELAYATGVAARIRAPAIGLDGLLVAEETRGGGLLLRGPGGAVGRVTRAPGTAVTVALRGTAAPYRGRSVPVGFRRGRLAERIYAADPAGERLSLLVGFPPAELAAGAAAWLAWPEEPRLSGTRPAPRRRASRSASARETGRRDIP
jgi:hypothetical protein